MAKNIIYRCEQNGLRMTDQRRVVAQVLETSHDHPDVEELYLRASKLDPRISIATVYREMSQLAARAARARPAAAAAAAAEAADSDSISLAGSEPPRTSYSTPR